MAAPVLQFKRGLLANLPGLRVGEPGFTTDSYDLYVGIDSSLANNKFFGSHRYWSKETTSRGSGVNLVEGTSNGSQYITLKSPDSLSGITTYTFPATPTADYFLKTSADGTLSWAAVVLNSFTGIVTFTDSTENTLGNANTGAVQIDGGLGVEKNVTVGGNLNVQGYSEFVGVVTFKGGTISLGDSDTDDIVIAGEFKSNLIPTDDATYNLGNGGKRWNNANFAGIVTATTFSGNASSADQVKTVTASDNNANYYVTFVDANNGSATNENVYTDDGIYYNPGTNTFTTQNALFTGNVTVNGTLTGTATTATRASLIDTANTTNNSDYYVTFVDTLAGQSSENLRVGIGLSVNPSNGDAKVAGSLSVGSPSAVNSYIKAGGGSNAMYLYTNGDVAFQQQVIVGGLRSSSNATNTLNLYDLDARFARNLVIAGIATVGTGVGITQFSSSVSTGSSASSVPTSSAVIDYVGSQIGGIDLTTSIAGDSGSGSVSTSQTLTIAGTSGEIETSASGQTITVGLPNTVVVGTALSSPIVKTATLQHSNGTQAATIDTSGNITASQNLTVSGNLYVNGSTTQVNTSSLTVEDRTIELGLVDGSAPGSSTTWDLGVLFNYNSSGAKKSAVIWEHADGRFKFGSQVTDGGGTDNDSPQITVSAYAGIEISSLWVNDCAGQSQVINCSGGVRTLENITIDGGSF